jgi:hypothetical protein
VQTPRDPASNFSLGRTETATRLSMLKSSLILMIASRFVGTSMCPKWWANFILSRRSEAGMQGSLPKSFNRGTRESNRPRWRGAQ